jgi:hypothetical protein
LGLVTGSKYRFQVMATNSVGNSQLSNIMEIFKASVPSKPSFLDVTLSGDLVEFNWEVPRDNGSALLTYKIMILTSDGVTFAREETVCASYDSYTIGIGRCQIGKSLLRGEPFNLAYGDEIQAKVIATNIVGDSESSDLATGTLLVKQPSPPVNLQNVPEITTATQIGL